MCWRDRRSFRSDVDVPGLARDFAKNVIRSGLTRAHRDDAVIEDTAVIVSELVTNAFNAGSTTIDVDLVLHRTRIRISVRDDAPGEPQAQHPQPQDEHGRGVLIVDALAADWGVLTSGNGKEVWALLDVAPDIVGRIDCTITAMDWRHSGSRARQGARVMTQRGAPNGVTAAA